ncbi:MAG: peptidoglycan D,D-transpeptidase FtsI family protein, partial [Tumebacillaceae bacterium]
AVVVLDAKTEDVLAMASRPNFDQNRPVTTNQYPVDLALKATFPGSVFKTVIAAAALESGIVKPTDEFDCPGYIDIGDGTLKCWTTHGHITAEEAFAESCNVTFATLAMKLGRDKIDEYAKKLGLGSAIGLSFDGQPQFPDEDPGSIFLKQGAAARLLANTGIGQEDVRITPLQAAHLMAVVANGGEAGTPRLVESMNTPDSLLYKEFQPAPKKRVLQASTAAELQKWCRDVVHADKGTARVLDNAVMPVAGKTGTAQTGDPNADHQWFAGFAPANNPKYIVVVVNESVPHGQQRITESTALQIINALPK